MSKTHNSSWPSSNVDHKTGEAPILSVFHAPYQSVYHTLPLSKGSILTWEVAACQYINPLVGHHGTVKFIWLLLSSVQFCPLLTLLNMVQ
jgi:hypothetical protein